MVSGSVDGLVSGMSTSSVISSLMSVEALPQTGLKNKVTTEQKVVTSYQSINSKMSGLLTASKALGDPLAWKGGTATSSSDAATVTASTTGTSGGGSLTFRVKQLAEAHSLVFDGTVADTGTSIMAGTDFKININGVEKTITTADTSLKGVVDAINKTADLGVKATAFQKAPGQYTMQLTSSTTGADSAFDFVDPSQFSALGSTQVATEGADAVLSVGTKTPFEVKSSSNTFKGLLDGLTVNAAKVQKADDAPVTVTVASDTEAIAGKVQAMIDAANSALSEIGSQTRNKNGAVAGGPLAGNSMMSQLSTNVLGTVSGGAGAAGGSFKAIGIELTRDGQLSFNKTTFLAALNADPEKTKAYFIDSTNGTDGLTDKMTAVADKATQSSTGTLSRLITSRTDAITELNDRIGDWDVRLTARQATLQKQFTAMETALGSLKNQSSWLSSQISSLG